MSATDLTATLPEQTDAGIWIQAPTHCRTSEGIRLRGEYRVPYREDDSVPNEITLIPKHIVLVATYYGQYAALKPYRDIVVFEDDVKDDGKYAAGHFNLNVFDHLPFNEGGDYYILCSLGNYLSNIVKVTVV